MQFLPVEILNILAAFSPVFSNPTWANAKILIIGAILRHGNRTVASCLKAMGLKMTSNFTNYHRVLNRAKWSSLMASKILLGMLVKVLPLGEVLKIVIDETLERRKGSKIKAKGCYRDAVRSSRKNVVKCFGLSWLCFMLIIQFPWSKRPWALPFLTILMPSENKKEKKKLHKTSIRWAIQGLRQIRRWYPARKLILLADGGFACFDIIIECIEKKITLYSRLQINAKLYEFPQPNLPSKRGPKPKKGKRIPKFKDMAKSSKYSWNSVEIPWYKGGIRKIKWISGVSLWHKTGIDPIPIRWVLVKDPVGKKELKSYLCNDLNETGINIIRQYILRWNVEVTFEESKKHLGIETQRQWNDLAITRTTPIIFGLFSIVCLMFRQIYGAKCILPAKSAWYKKTEITFSDVIAVVRRQIWVENYLNSKKTAKRRLFHRHEVKALIDQFLEVA